MKDYGVKSYWAVSTSGIREAENREYVLEQIRSKTGILIEVINNSQERFLFFKALRDKLQDSQTIYNEGAMIVNIGSGGVEVSIYHEGNLKFTEYIKIGSLRLREILSGLEEKTLNFPEVMREYVESKINFSMNFMKSVKIKNFVGIGGSLKLLLKLYDENNQNYVSKQLFLDFYYKICEMSTEKISDTYDLSLSEANLLLPSTTIVVSFLNLTEAEGIYIPQISLRYGMLIDMISRKYNTKKKEVFYEDVISSIWYIGQKYGIDTEHCKNVEKIALSIFDQTLKIHRFKEKERMILQISAILHDVGKYINIDDHGVYSYNIIHNEKIIGFSDRDVNIVANIARYHGEDIPSFSHENYNVLNYKDKLIISKLGAILKLSEALNSSNRKKIKDVKITYDERFIYFALDTYEDCTLEIWKFEIYAEFFEEVLGLRPVIELKK